jgi:hypothetical protein
MQIDRILLASGCQIGLIEVFKNDNFIPLMGLLVEYTSSPATGWVIESNINVICHFGRSLSRHSVCPFDAVKGEKHKKSFFGLIGDTHWISELIIHTFNGEFDRKRQLLNRAFCHSGISENARVWIVILNKTRARRTYPEEIAVVLFNRILFQFRHLPILYIPLPEKNQNA